MTTEQAEQLSVRYSGGWRGDGYPATMSDSLVRRLMLQEQAEQRDERERAEGMRAWRGDPATRANLAAAAMAEARGEYVSPRDALSGRGLGRTHQEILAYSVACADLEDRRQAVQLRRAGVDPDELQADTSAPSAQEVATRARLNRWHADRHEERERFDHPARVALAMIEATEEQRRNRAMAQARQRAARGGA